MQWALLAEPQLTFTKALQMIQTMETADRDSRELQAQTTSPVPVNTVSRTQATALKPCFRCGEQHSPATCCFKDFVWNFCKKTGHIVRACRSKQRAGNNQQSRSGGDTHHVTATDQEDSYSLFNINGLGHQPFYITLTFQGEQLQMELDTGAAVSVMSEQTYKTVWNAEKAPPIEPALCLHRGHYSCSGGGQGYSKPHESVQRVTTTDCEGGWADLAGQGLAY